MLRESPDQGTHTPALCPMRLRHGEAQPSLRPFASQTRGASHIAAHHDIPAVCTVAAHRAHLPHITLAGKLENQLQ